MTAVLPANNGDSSIGTSTGLGLLLLVQRLGAGSPILLILDAGTSLPGSLCTMPVRQCSRCAGSANKMRRGHPVPVRHARYWQLQAGFFAWDNNHDIQGHTSNYKAGDYHEGLGSNPVVAQRWCFGVLRANPRCRRPCRPDGCLVWSDDLRIPEQRRTIVGCGRGSSRFWSVG